MNSVKRTLAPYYRNLFGWRTDRKIVVIESDDWGSIRMPSREVYDHCLAAGYRVDKIAYERYDSLASEEDLQMLFELLGSFTDRNVSHPVITANVLTANPDFEKIASTGFREYHYELVSETFQRYPRHAGCFRLWKEGMEAGYFFPQSHGREHLNVSMFMRALQKGDRDALFGFNHKMPGSINWGEKAGGNRYVEALRYKNEADKEAKLEILIEGLALFKKLFGYKSETLIPPNYIWSSDFDREISGCGIRFYQGNRKMKEPGNDGHVKLRKHRLGGINQFGQRYLIRNAIFEPSLFNLNIADPVSHCLNEITAAFRMKKPAVICSHRLNFIGYIDESNRDSNLKLFRDLLKKILKKWPEVEFLNSVQLGNEIVRTPSV